MACNQLEEQIAWLIDEMKRKTESPDKFVEQLIKLF